MRTATRQQLSPVEYSVSSKDTDKQIVGWREWVSLPSLGIVGIRAKLDTGAKTSALHAWDIRPFKRKGQQLIRFRVLQAHEETGASEICEAPLTDHRWVTNSSGMKERRYIIVTDLKIGSRSWPIELSLANRETMEYPMIIGREAMRNRLIVDPRASFRAGKNPPSSTNGPIKEMSDPESNGIAK